MFGALIKRASANSTALPSKTVLRTKILDSIVLFQCGERNSLKTINVDGQHFIPFRGKNSVFKFIRLSVDVAQILLTVILLTFCFLDRTSFSYLSGILTFVVAWVIFGLDSESQLSESSSRDFMVKYLIIFFTLKLTYRTHAFGDGHSTGLV